jgi:hypothetical protein
MVMNMFDIIRRTMVFVKTFIWTPGKSLHWYRDFDSGKISRNF